MRQKSNRVIRFVGIQFTALIGWVAVQSFFSLSSFGQTLPFALIIVIEGIWWGGLLFIMFLLFLSEYRRFAQAAIDLEDANTRLREETNRLFRQVRQAQKEDAAIESSSDVQEVKAVEEVEDAREVEEMPEVPVVREHSASKEM